MALKWFGKEVSEKMRRAQIAGVNKTMGAAVIHAKRNHSWKNRTGTLEGSINIVEFARPSGRGVRGMWGSQDVRYALVHELGSDKIPKRPYLRPAADATYPQLAENIRRAYAGGL